MSKYKFETTAIHAAYKAKDHNNASTVPIYQTVAYDYDSAEHAAKLFKLEKFGNIYTRIGNPTTGIFENRIAELYNAAGALATSSGQAAQFIAISTLANSGDNILASSHLYGGTFNQFNVTLRKFGIDVRFFDPENVDEIEELSDEKTKAVFIESIGNPSIDIPDFEKISEQTKKIGIPLICDNTFPSAALFNPFKFGANIVVESLSKYVGGSGSSIGGLIVDGGNFDWSQNDRFEGFTTPSPGYHGLKFYETFGNIAFIIKARVEGLRDIGATLSPSNAFYYLQGLETLALRQERHSVNAFELGKFLEQHPLVKKVWYPSLPTSKYVKRTKKYFPTGCSGVLSFELKGGIEAGETFIESVQVAKHQTNLGDNKTIVTHPASTTHQQLSLDDQLACGITPGLIRVSVGIENIDDIIEDFKLAIEG